MLGPSVPESSYGRSREGVLAKRTKGERDHISQHRSPTGGGRMR